MSFLTALSLSFNNLMTKKGRTFLVAFAGSIGIIGIAAILALSNGVNGYIAEREESALSAYPLTVNKSSINMASMMGADSSESGGSASSGEASPLATDGSAQASDVISQDLMLTDMFAQVKNNDLRSFKAFLDGGGDGIWDYVNTIQYNYGVTPLVYKADTSDGLKQLNPSQVVSTMASGAMGSALTGGTSSNPFQELVSDQDLLDEQLDVVAGHWPENANECVLVLDQDGEVSDYTLYSIGFYDVDEMNSLVQDALQGNEIEAPEHDETFTVGDALGMDFKVVPASARYQRNAQTGTWTDMSGDDSFMRAAVEEGIDLRVVGVVKPKKEEGSLLAQEGIGYSHDLTELLMERAATSQIVQDQQANPDVDVFTGKTFEELQSEQGTEFDMSQVFSVDEDKLRSAFSFDSSALTGMASGLDLSGLDLSGMTGGTDPSGLDLSNVQLDTSALSGVFSQENLAKLLAGAPQFDASQVDVSDEERSAIQQAATELGTGFVSWLQTSGQVDLSKIQDMSAEDFQRLWEAYLAANPEAQAKVDALQEMGQPVVDQVVDEYVQGQLVPYFSSALQQMVQQAAQVMALQLSQQLQAQVAAATQQMGSQLSSAISGQLAAQMSQLTTALQSGFSVDADAFRDAIKLNMTQDDLTSLLTSFMNAKDLSYDANMETLGYAEEDSPESISIYPHDFNDKESVLDIIEGYNQRMRDADREDETIQYSDLAGTLMSSVTDIVNMISDVLIAFVSISLVVSSIMIGVITYISVLERKKEIGILRAMGASKFNVANIFNAETVIEGLMSGAFAVAVVYLVSVPVNSFVLQWKNVPSIMRLPWSSALVLIGISVFLTFVAGLIPSMKASRRDPVEALRSE